MSSSALQKSENSITEPRDLRHPVTRSARGLRISACEKTAGQPQKPSMKDSLTHDPAGVAEPTFTSGTSRRRLSCSMGCVTQEPILEFTVQQSGSLGQEILDGDGDVIAWTLDESLAIQICELFNR